MKDSLVSSSRPRRCGTDCPPSAGTARPTIFGAAISESPGPPSIYEYRFLRCLLGSGADLGMIQPLVARPIALQSDFVIAAVSTLPDDPE